MSLIYINELVLIDRSRHQRTIRRDDKVAIRPVELREVGAHDTRLEDIARLEDWLGADPLTIKQLAYWPCGRGMIYFADGKRPGAGCRASEFIAV